jgi:hypothetical protein
LQISTGTNHFIASVFFEERFIAGVAFAEERCSHGFFDDVFRSQGIISSLINYHQPSAHSCSSHKLLEIQGSEEG